MAPLTLLRWNGSQPARRRMVICTSLAQWFPDLGPWGSSRGCLLQKTGKWPVCSCVQTSAMYHCGSSHQGVETIALLFESIGRVTCLGWCDTNRCLESLCVLRFASTRLLESTRSPGLSIGWWHPSRPHLERAGPPVGSRLQMAGGPCRSLQENRLAETSPAC